MNSSRIVKDDADDDDENDDDDEKELLLHFSFEASAWAPAERIIEMKMLLLIVYWRSKFKQFAS